MPVLANDMVQTLAKVGDKLPHTLELQDETGVVRNYEDLIGEKGTVLVFVRSADWCPYCQVQLLDIKSDAQPIVDLGYNIVSVSYDDPEKLKVFKDKYKYPYVMLSDKESAAIKAFGILNDKYEPDHFAYGVPHPYIFIVGKDKQIQAVLSEEGYRKRPQVDVIVEAIADLGE